MSDTSVYANDDHAAPDSAFAAGELCFLVAGNRGRLLDARRTPITVVGVAPERGSFVVRIDAFEDTGARWDLGLEEIERFQFAQHAATISAEQLAELQRSVAHFDRDLIIECDPAIRGDSLRRLHEAREHALGWLREHHETRRLDLAEQIQRRQGRPAVYGLLDEFLAARGLAELERRFTATFVTNPRSGEVVKGHAIVLAELGLCPYRGKIPRDPDLFTGTWSRARRADHLLWRLAFTHELFAALGANTVTLYRAAATDRTLLPPLASSLVSATFSRQVAEAHFDGGTTTQAAALWRQVVPIERLLMSFLETKAMNERFHEAEAVLLADPANRAF